MNLILLLTLHHLLIHCGLQVVTPFATGIVSIDALLGQLYVVHEDWVLVPSRDDQPCLEVIAVGLCFPL